MNGKPVAILLVEKDINWGRFLQSYLERKGFTINFLMDGMAAWKRWLQGTVDFCIINAELPSLDGCSLACRIRERAQHMPIVLMTDASHNEESTRIECFNAGADDVIALPCSLEEILWRIRTIYKRFRFCPIEADTRIFDLGELRFDYNKHLLFNAEHHIRLTTKEADLLFALCLNRGRVLERDKALLAVWKSDEAYNIRSMDVYISKLRQLLFSYTYSEIINIHGVGFKLITHHDAGFRQIMSRDRRTIRYRRQVRRSEKDSETPLAAGPVADGTWREDGAAVDVMTSERVMTEAAVEWEGRSEERDGSVGNGQSARQNEAVGMPAAGMLMAGVPGRREAVRRRKRGMSRIR